MGHSVEEIVPRSQPDSQNAKLSVVCSELELEAVMVITGIEG